MIATITDLNISLMPERDYLAYQRLLDDQLAERYYARDLTPPGMTPLPPALADLQPPF